jgi:hypothetical protein
MLLISEALQQQVHPHSLPESMEDASAPLLVGSVRGTTTVLSVFELAPDLRREIP